MDNGKHVSYQYHMIYIIRASYVYAKYTKRLHEVQKNKISLLFIKMCLYRIPFFKKIFYLRHVVTMPHIHTHNLSLFFLFFKLNMHKYILVRMIHTRYTNLKHTLNKCIDFIHSVCITTFIEMDKFLAVSTSWARQFEWP